MSAPFKVVSSDPAERVADLDESIHSARVLQWNASQMHNARGVFRAERILEQLYAERDAIVAAHPSADHDGRVLGARRRASR
jgi:hypothetical protein